MGGLKFPKLFEPVTLGRQVFRNRIFSSAQDIYRLTAENFLDDGATFFYERKAQGGFASVCVGDVIIDSAAGKSHPFQLHGDDNRGKVSMTRTAMAISRHGAVAAAELNHAGANAMPNADGFVYGFEDGVRADGVPVHRMDEAWIERLIACYADAAAFVRQSGFQMINLHGGHGWLIHQFLSPRDNRLPAPWGGSFEARMRFPLAVVEAVRRRVGNAMPIEMRLSASEWLPDGYGPDEGLRIAQALDGKLDLINVSIGHHEIDAASMRTHPTMFLPDGCNVQFAADIKKHIKTPVSCVGALTDPAMMEEIIASGKADIVELGRQTLADPDLPIKARMGRDEDVNRCMRCLTCFSASTVSGIFYCATNPEIGNEEYALMGGGPARFKKTVLVAGGGVGGMQAALTASQRGHRVILCEKTGRLGGALLCEDAVPFKDKLKLYLERQARRVASSNIELRLNTEVTPELAESVGADVIIAALGARPVKPRVPGIDRENVMGAEEAYTAPEKVGRSAVIMGGGLVGLELGLFLAQSGRDVTVIEMMPATVATPAAAGTSERISGKAYKPFGEPLVQGVAIGDLLTRTPNMRVMCSTAASKITEDGLVCVKDGVELLLAADTVIYAVGQRPLTEQANALRECAPEFYALGDCMAAKNILAATQPAWQAAMDIGRI